MGDDLTSLASESMVPESAVKNKEIKKNPTVIDEDVEIAREPQILKNSRIIEPEEDDIERLQNCINNQGRAARSSVLTHMPQSKTEDMQK